MSDVSNGVPGEMRRRRADQRILTRSGVADSPIEIARHDGRWLVGRLQDITERKRIEAQARRLADEQSALHRVAALVALGAEPGTVFDAVCEETGRLLGATRTRLTALGANGAGRPVAAWGKAEGSAATEITAPVLVDGRVWGHLSSRWQGDEQICDDAGERLASFADLTATAVSNADARAALIASRARILAAADASRTKIERDLHDGTQQQLVSLDLELQLLRAEIESAPSEVFAHVERIREQVATVLRDVQEISRGVHPATLSQRGLGPALRALARRSPVPVELDLQVPDRLPPSVEMAAFYGVSEALANIVKHAGDASAVVAATSEPNGLLRLDIRDDGPGGANPHGGSGLTGLVDRIEALSGTLQLTSPPGEGTRISIELPLD